MVQRLTCILAYIFEQLDTRLPTVQEVPNEGCPVVCVIHRSVTL